MRGNQPSKPKVQKACVICRRMTKQRHQAAAGLFVGLCGRCRRNFFVCRAAPLPPIWTPPDELECIARSLLAEADLLSLMAQSRWLMAHALIERVEREAPQGDDSESFPTSKD